MKHRSSLVAACLLACVFAAPAQAGLLETDFPAGGLPARIFEVSSGQATISTDLGNAIVAVTLFQAVDLSGFAGGTALKLAFDLVGLNAPPGLYFAGLNYDCQPGLISCITIDALQGASSPRNYMVDVSAAAGSPAFVTFNVGAFPGTPDALMTVDNVRLTAATVETLMNGDFEDDLAFWAGRSAVLTNMALPEPLTAALLVAGLAFAGRARRRTR